MYILLSFLRTYGYKNHFWRAPNSWNAFIISFTFILCACGFTYYPDLGAFLQCRSICTEFRPYLEKIRPLLIDFYPINVSLRWSWVWHWNDIDLGCWPWPSRWPCWWFWLCYILKPSSSNNICRVSCILGWISPIFASWDMLYTRNWY